MKRIALVLGLITSAVFAVDLTQATNAQLLDELSRRLTGGQSGTTAFANYLCDSNYLKVSLVGEKTGETSLYLGSQERCTQQTQILNRFKSKISSLTVIALCDSNYLKRFKLLPSGEVKEIDSLYLGDYNKCFDQARPINQN